MAVDGFHDRRDKSLEFAFDDNMFDSASQRVATVVEFGTDRPDIPPARSALRDSLEGGVRICQAEESVVLSLYIRRCAAVCSRRSRESLILSRAQQVSQGFFKRLIGRAEGLQFSQETSFLSGKPGDALVPGLEHFLQL